MIRSFGARIARSLLSCYVMLLYLFLYTPIIILVIFSFNDGNFADHWQGFSLRWYRAMVQSPEILAALKASLIVAVSSTVLSLAMGTTVVVASRWLRRRRAGRNEQGGYEQIFFGNVMIPDIVLGIGLLCLFSLLSLPLGYKSLIVGHTVVGLGFVVPIIRSRFAQIDPILTEASLDLGATQWQTIRRVILPLLFPAFVAATLLVFTLSLDDFVISFFCAGSHIETLSVYVFNQIKNMVDPTINALSTCVLLLSSISVTALAYFNILDDVVNHE